MTRSDVRKVNDVIECESFDYAFAHYTEFNDIEDSEFHRLREEYLDARKALIAYAKIEDA